MKVKSLLLPLGVIIGGITNLAIFFLLYVGPTQCRLFLVPLSLLLLSLTVPLSIIALRQRTRTNVLAAVLALLLCAPLLVMYVLLVLLVAHFAVHGDI